MKLKLGRERLLHVAQRMAVKLQGKPASKKVKTVPTKKKTVKRKVLKHPTRTAVAPKRKVNGDKELLGESAGAGTRAMDITANRERITGFAKRRNARRFAEAKRAEHEKTKQKLKLDDMQSLSKAVRKTIKKLKKRQAGRQQAKKAGS